MKLSKTLQVNEGYKNIIDLLQIGKINKDIKSYKRFISYNLTNIRASLIYIKILFKHMFNLIYNTILFCILKIIRAFILVSKNKDDKK